MDNDGSLPDELQALYPHPIHEVKDFFCLTDPKRPANPNQNDIGVRGSYALVPGMYVTMPGSFIVAYDKSPDNHGGKGRNVAFIDGRVEWWPVEREEEFQKRLASQTARLREWSLPARSVQEGQEETDP